MAKRISTKTVGEKLVLEFHGNRGTRSFEEHTLVKLEGTSDDARATFRDASGMDWEAYRYNGHWAYGSGAHRLSVPANRNEDPKPAAPAKDQMVPVEGDDVKGSVEYIAAKAERMARTAAEELEAIARHAADLAKQVRRSPSSGYSAHGLTNELAKAAAYLAKAEALFALLED